MPLLFIDYSNLVLKEYEERRNSNRLSGLLMHPTTANIRQECLNVYNERIKKGETEEDILRAFFGVPPAGRSFDYVIERHHADKFRPLRSLIKRKIRIPSLVIVELLAWLIDFNPRPLAFAQTTLGTTNEPLTPVKDSNENQSETETAEANVLEIKKGLSSVSILDPENLSLDGKNKIPATLTEDTNKLSEKKRKGNSQTRKLKIVAAIGLIIAILFGGMYFIWQYEKSVNTVCVYWANDHYEQVPCNEDSKGRHIQPMNPERIKSFRKVTQQDTITEWSVGKLYYIKDSNIIKCYTEAGNYPEDVNRTLKVLSRRIFEKYLRKKDTSDKDSITEQSNKLTNNK